MSTSSFLKMKVVFVFVFILFSSSGSRVRSTRGASRLEYTISEELPTGSVVGNVKRDSNLESELDAAALRRLRFYFRSAESRDLFALNERTGVIATADVIDRDRKCPRSAACDVTVDVTVRGATNYFRLIRVVVHVVDVNDNRPRFDEDHVTVHVMETAQAGTLFVLPSAEDADADVNGVTEYRLQTRDGNNSVPFDLLVTDQGGGSKDVRLRLLNGLDREKVSHYTVVVMALDGGDPQHSASLVVDVVVTDSNDNIPHFDRSSYEAEVAEDTPVQTTIARVHASDEDTGENGHVTYRWAEHTDSAYGSLFGIDAETGDVFLKSQLDYELSQIYKLTVMAVDSGAGALPVFAKLTLRVTDVNDNAPVIVVNALTGSSVAEVREHVDPTGTFVAHVAVTDADTGHSGRTRCELEDSEEFRLEPLMDGGEYKLTTTTTFDREVRSEYSVTLRCEDEGEPSQSTTASVIVRVADINDHSPSLPADTIRVSVVENNRHRTVLTRVNASDMDAGQNAQLSYHLQPASGQTQNTASWLVIDEVTGVISTNHTFDYEQGPNVLRYIVTVTDAGDPAKSATATVRLSVTDTNDQRPRFGRRLYHVTVPEDVAVGTSVGRVNATDDDVTPRFSHVTYALPVPSDSFKVDEESGVLRTIRRLDRERQASYMLTVTASDGSTAQPATAEVSVTVEDVNDNRPTMSDRVVVDLFASRGDLSEGALVTRLVAADRDDGANAVLEYAVEHGNERGLFAVDRQTGAVTVAALGGLDHRPAVYRLVVSATDRGDPPLRTVADLEIRVNNTDAYPSSGAALETSNSLLAQTGNIIILSGLVLAVLFITTLVLITVCCFRRHARRRRKKYLSVNRDQPVGDLPLKTFPDVGGPTQTYHTGCDLGLSASGSVCLCRDLSSQIGDSVSVGSRSSYRQRANCRGCDGGVTSHKMAAAAMDPDFRSRCTGELGASRDMRMTSPGTPSCCGSCCEGHSATSAATAPLQGPRSCCAGAPGMPASHRHHRHHHRHRQHRHQPSQHHHHTHHHRRRSGRQATTSASSCSSSSAPSSPVGSLRRFPLPPPLGGADVDLDGTSTINTQPVGASPFELRRLPDMLKALESRYDEVEKLTSGGDCASQLHGLGLVGGRGPLPDSEFDAASSSTSCADSGRGLSCEVHDDLPRSSLSSAGLSAPRRGNAILPAAVTLPESLMAHSSALDACRQTLPPQSHPSYMAN